MCGKMNVLKNGDAWHTNTAKLYKVSITTDKVVQGVHYN